MGFKGFDLSTPAAIYEEYARLKAGTTLDISEQWQQGRAA